MKSFALVAVALIFAPAALAQHQTFAVNADASDVKMKLNTTHEVVNGTFHVQSGSINCDRTASHISGIVIVAAGSGNSQIPGPLFRMREGELHSVEIRNLTKDSEVVRCTARFSLNSIGATKNYAQFRVSPYADTQTFYSTFWNSGRLTRIVRLGRRPLLAAGYRRSNGGRHADDCTCCLYALYDDAHAGRFPLVSHANVRGEEQGCP